MHTVYQKHLAAFIIKDNALYFFPKGFHEPSVSFSLPLCPPHTFLTFTLAALPSSYASYIWTRSYTDLP